MCLVKKIYELTFVATFIKLYLVTRYTTMSHYVQKVTNKKIGNGPQITQTVTVTFPRVGNIENVKTMSFEHTPRMTKIAMCVNKHPIFITIPDPDDMYYNEIYKPTSLRSKCIIL